MVLLVFAAHVIPLAQHVLGVYSTTASLAPNHHIYIFIVMNAETSALMELIRMAQKYAKIVISVAPNVLPQRSQHVQRVTTVTT